MKFIFSSFILMLGMLAASCGEDKGKTQDTKELRFDKISQDYSELPSGIIARVPVGGQSAPEIRSFYGEGLNESNIHTQFINSRHSDVYGQNPQTLALANPQMLNVPGQFLGSQGKVGQYPSKGGKGGVGQYPGQYPAKAESVSTPVNIRQKAVKAESVQYPGQYPTKSGVSQFPGQYPGQYISKGGKGGVGQYPSKSSVNQSPLYLSNYQASSIAYDYSYNLDFHLNYSGNFDYNDYYMNHFRPIHRSRYYPHNWGYYQRPRRWIANNYCYYYYPRPRCSNYGWCR